MLKVSFFFLLVFDDDDAILPHKVIMTMIRLSLLFLTANVKNASRV
jgi:hypothetical protein